MKNISKIKPKYSDVEIRHFDNIHQFMDASVELHKQTIELLHIITKLKYCDSEGLPKIVDKENAVIGGNLIRLIKLNISFLQNTCENRLEIVQILNRCLAETAINTKFLIIRGEENVIKNYIKYSLITEKELWETILSNIQERSGDVLPIENRMQKSIQNSFDNSDFDIEEVKRSSKWKSIKERANDVAGEMFYNVFYGISSHSIHGNWQDILFNHLTKVDDGFKINFDWKRPRPQIIDGAIILNLDIVKTFCEYEATDEPLSKVIIEKCEMLFNYHNVIKTNHELWLKNKSEKN